ncbi:MAG: HEAT repeat domain-containing protein [Myxococcota bacterium]
MSDPLEAIFAAERALRTAEAELLAGDPDAVAETLRGAVNTALAEGDADERALRLERLADLCAQVPGGRLVDAILAILNVEEPQVRGAAAECLEAVAYDYYGEVARATEKALSEPLLGPAMTELPYLFAEIGEPSAVPLLKGFLAHPDAAVVAAAVESAAVLGDPALVPALEALQDDPRDVTVADFEEETSASIGELAREALSLLGD